MAVKRGMNVDLNSVFEGAASQFRGLNPNEPGQWPMLPKLMTWAGLALAMVVLAGSLRTSSAPTSWRAASASRRLSLRGASATFSSTVICWTRL